MGGGYSLPSAATELKYMERLHALGAFQFALNSQHTFPQYLH